MKTTLRSGLSSGIGETSSDMGFNQLELLLFRLDSDALFGINVFKVREIIRTPPITPAPQADPRILGLATLRDVSISMIDLGRAIGLPSIAPEQARFTLVTEFNRRLQGFVVVNVERIAYLSWQKIVLPPSSLAHASYLTAIARVKDEMAQIIDVERVMAELTGETVQVSADMARQAHARDMRNLMVLGVDDSLIARKHLRKVFESLGIGYRLAQDGRQALNLLRQWADEAEQGMGPPVSERLLMVVSDVEMPEMDGYHLVQAIRRDPRLRELYVVLNSSLSSQANLRFAQRVGADRFFTKWSADELGELILERARRHYAESSRRRT